MLAPVNMADDVVAKKGDKVQIGAFLSIKAQLLRWRETQLRIIIIRFTSILFSGLFLSLSNLLLY